MSGGIVYSWAANQWGQLGDGTLINRIVPIQSLVSNAIAIGAGHAHSLAVLADGSVWGWGANGNGQLGNGTTTSPVLNPTQVPGISNAVKVAGGESFSIVLLADGTVWTWGYNGHGQLGNGTQIDSFVPVQVQGITNAIDIAAGPSHALALLADGSLWSWGDNSHGQLGSGVIGASFSPLQVQGISNVTAISTGNSHSLAVLADGSVWAWGNNSQGQLGDGTTHSRLFPVQVVGINNAKGVAGDKLSAAIILGYSFAVLLDGTVKGWGRSATFNYGNVPVTVNGISTATDIASGNDFAIALLADDTVVAWGTNFNGLGDGVSTSSNVPVQVVGLNSVTAISTGSSFNLAIQLPAPTGLKCDCQSSFILPNNTIKRNNSEIGIGKLVNVTGRRVRICQNCSPDNKEIFGLIFKGQDSIKFVAESYTSDHCCSNAGNQITYTGVGKRTDSHGTTTANFVLILVDGKSLTLTLNNNETFEALKVGNNVTIVKCKDSTPGC